MAKIKFTSKKDPKPSKLERAAGNQRGSGIYYQGERIGSIVGNSELNFYCKPKNVRLRLKNAVDHRAAVNWVKEHAQELWEKYPFTAKLKEEEEQS